MTIADGLVDPTTGRVVVRATDVILEGAFPWGFHRRYDSSRSQTVGSLGRGWSHSLEQRVVETGGTHPVRLDERGRARPVTRTTSRGAIVVREADREYEYDSTGRLVAVSGAHGRITRRGELALDDHLGRGLSLDLRSDRVDLAIGVEGVHRVVRTYVLAGSMLRSVLDEHGELERYEYDGSLLVEVHRRGCASLAFEYDGRDHLARCSRVVSGGGVRDRAILHAGDRVVVEDRGGGARSLVLGARGTVTSSVAPDGRQATFDFDDEGCLTAERDEAGQTWRRARSRTGELVGVTVPDGSTVPVEHAGGRCVRIGDWAFEYDGLGLLRGAVHAHDAVRVERRDGLIRRLEISGASVTIDYDRAQRIRQLTAGSGIRVHADVNGAVLEMLAGCVRVERRRREEGYELVHRSPSGATQKLLRAHDGRLLSVDRAGALTTFDYDAGDQLIGWRTPLEEARITRGADGSIRAVQSGGDELHVVRDRAGRVVRLHSSSGRARDLERDRHSMLRRVMEDGAALAPAERAAAPVSSLPEGHPLCAALAPVMRLHALRPTLGLELPEQSESDLDAACRAGRPWPLAEQLFHATLAADAVAAPSALDWRPRDPRRARTLAPLPDPVHELCGASPLSLLQAIARDLLILLRSETASR